MSNPPSWNRVKGVFQAVLERPADDRAAVLQTLCAGARDTRLGRTVAIKVLPARLHVDDARYQRFEREARAIATLDHPSARGTVTDGAVGRLRRTATQS